MKKILELARRAEEANEVPVGAVLVKDNQLIVEDWNHSPSPATMHLTR